MAKVLLVEDDNNLREIYEARLQAEGYDIVSARDGEEALVVAKAELPDLVVSDVMMPKISGFEMLDILRNTEGLKDVKVIMLTALGQAEDQTRADSLGADRYLVKSQVTLEDIVNAAQQLLSGDTPAPAETPEPAAVEVPEPQIAAPAPMAAPAPTEPSPVIPVAAPPTDPVAAPIVTPPAPEAPAPEPVAPQPQAAPATPVSEPATAATPVNNDAQQSQADEQAAVTQQIEDFVQSQTGTPPAAAEPAVEPVAVAPETTAPTTTPEQEQALNEAVANLSGNEAPAAPTETPAPQAEAPAPAPTPESPAAEPEATNTTTHQRVITPITDAESPKKSLEDLLAEEAAREAATAAPTETPAPQAEAPAPEQQPAPQQPPKPQNNDFDPNSIAL